MHRRGRGHGQDLAQGEMVEEHAQRGEVQLDAGPGDRAVQFLNVRRDDDGLDLGPLDPSDFAPVAEPNGGAGVGFAGVRVAKDGGEEFEKAWARRRAGMADQPRQSRFQRFDSHSANPLQVPHSGFPLGVPCRDPKRTLCLTMRGLRKRATRSGLGGAERALSESGAGFRATGNDGCGRAGGLPRTGRHQRGM